MSLRPHTARLTLCLSLTSLALFTGCGTDAGTTGGGGGDTGATSGSDAAASADGTSTDTGTVTGADTGATADASAGNADAGATAADTGSAASDTGSATTDTGGAAPDATTADTNTPDTAAPDTGATDTGAGTPDVGSSGGAWGVDKCVKAGSGVGFNVGQQVDDLPLYDCDSGAPRKFSEVCGADATWLFVAHSHCPTCQATAKYTASVAKKYADKNVAVVHVVYIDDHQNCPDWRKKYGLEGLKNVKVYLDKTGASWGKIKTKNYTAPHAIMTKDRVITYKAHGLSSAGVSKYLDAALKP